MEPVKKLSFRAKNVTVCPICSNEFHREELLSGGGRLIAGKLTDELRRLYEESKKFGSTNPLYYFITVCPRCLYAAYPKDFNAIEPSETDKLRELSSTRRNAIAKFFGSLDFNEDRGLEAGAASYLLAVDCYSYRNKRTAPTVKRAICSLRAAWLFADLMKLHPEMTYGKISSFFYKKGFEYYAKVIDILQNGAEPVEAAGTLGPDLDKNWGYEGVLYLFAVLTLKVGAREPDVKVRIENFEKAKRNLSRVFGIGKASKSRPSDLLDKCKDLFDKMGEQIEQWTQESEAKDGTESLPEE